MKKICCLRRLEQEKDFYDLKRSKNENKKRRIIRYSGYSSIP
jgi:hypothetical protein